MGGFADQAGEAAGECGARDAGGRSQVRHGPGAGGLVVQGAQGGTRDGLAQCAVPGRGFGALPGEPGAQGADEQQVEQPVQDDLLAGLVDGDLFGDQVQYGAGAVGGGQVEYRRECAQQAVPDVSGYRVGAGEQRGSVEWSAAGAGDGEWLRFGGCTGPRGCRPVRWPGSWGSPEARWRERLPPIGRRSTSAR
ncbi:hypothetical protein GCM10010442_67060 [Kitasatospora kifunensis]